MYTHTHIYTHIYIYINLDQLAKFRAKVVSCGLVKRMFICSDGVFPPVAARLICVLSVVKPPQQRTVELRPQSKLTNLCMILTRVLPAKATDGADGLGL